MYINNAPMSSVREVFQFYFDIGLVVVCSGCGFMVVCCESSFIEFFYSLFNVQNLKSLVSTSANGSSIWFSGIIIRYADFDNLSITSTSPIIWMRKMPSTNQIFFRFIFSPSLGWARTVAVGPVAISTIVPGSTSDREKT